MADILFGVSQSSLIFHHHHHHHHHHHQSKLALRFHPTTTHSSHSLRYFKPLSVLSSDSSTVTGFAAVDSELDTGGGIGGDKFGGRGGGGNGGGKGDGGESEDSNNKKMDLSLSQKLTIGYAALVGVGGLMGYMKSGSQKSLVAGGLSAAALFYVFTELPIRPVFASSIGLGVSAALMGVMGTRFKRSGKIFPAGVVSVTSLIMAGGYVHGIIRSGTH